MVELLKQPQYSPVRVDQQIVAILQLRMGFWILIQRQMCVGMRKSLLEFLLNKHSYILKNILEQKTISPETKTQLLAALNEFKSSFQPSK